MFQVLPLLHLNTDRRSVAYPAISDCGMVGATGITGVWLVLLVPISRIWRGLLVVQYGA
jgi:hypothetical protein